MNFQTFLSTFFLSAFVIIIPDGTDALQCYVCNSTECQTTFDPTEHSLVDCGGYCYKTTMEDMSGNMMFVKRGCEPSDFEHCPGDCLEAGSRQCNMCCQEDRCNSATTLSTYLTLPALIALVWFISSCTV